MKETYVYRLVGIYSGKPERKVYSRYQLGCKLAIKSGGKPWHLKSFRIERARVGEWQDVTAEFDGSTSLADALRASLVCAVPDCTAHGD